MAEFIQVEKNKYKINGVLTEDDIEQINQFKNRTTLILDNTVGLSNDLISKISSDRVVFSIKGGLDYETKGKYNNPEYINRTLVSPNGLKKIIRYFEYNESWINPNWSEMEKAMFLYNALVIDMDYEEKYEEVVKGVERSLNGILYGKLVCSGFALAYKEMLDRVGIKNYYQNVPSKHSFNIIEIDNKKYGVDITWDNTAKKRNNGLCGFGYFAHDKDFYANPNHKLHREFEVEIGTGEYDSEGFEITETVRTYSNKEEEEFELSVLDMGQINTYYHNIEGRIKGRKPAHYDLLSQPIEIRNKYLPVDLVRLNLEDEINKESLVSAILSFLKKRNALFVDSQLTKAFIPRNGYLADFGDYKYEYNLSNVGLNDFKITASGDLIFDNGDVTKIDRIAGVLINKNNLDESEINMTIQYLNQYLTNYFNKYLLAVIDNIDSLLENYEGYKPEEFDENRLIEYGNISTKLSFVENSRDYLVGIGVEEKMVDSAIEKIKNKKTELHSPYRSEISKKENDLDFLSAVLEDFDVIRQAIENDLQETLSDEEFITVFSNADYMKKILSKYIKIAGEELFNMEDYDISQEDFQQLLNQTIYKYQQNKENTIGDRHR